MLGRLYGSLAQRGLHGTLARIRQEFQHRCAQDTLLSLLPLQENAEGLQFEVHAEPQVSIIIPVHGKLAYTLTCLRSLSLHAQATPFEIIVVDDASPDASVVTLQNIPGIHVLVNAQNLGFVGSCNAGAAIARGEFLLFLNNDTQVTVGWLQALLRCFAEEPDCGIAGSKLVYPDGRLQEAGGWIFNNAAGWNVGRFDDRNKSAYRYRRRTDYVSGAALMIRRDTFVAIDGFDRRYSPAYYEDTDLAFAVRAAGWSVYYEPNSLVIHCEGISAGTDLSGGMKRYQAINQTTFATKWHETLRAQPKPGTSEEQLWQRYTRGHILVVDSTTPDSSRDSGSLRLSSILHILHREGWRLSFAPDDGYASEQAIARLGDLGVEVLCRPELTHLPAWLRQHGNTLHAVMLCRHTVAGQYIQTVRRYAPQAKLILDTVDLHFLREQRAAELDNNAALRRKADASRRSEMALINACDVSFVVSPHEQALLRNIAPHARVELLSNIHEVHGRQHSYAGRRDLLFIGGYAHTPNADAMHWMADEILPALRQRIPELCIHIVGDIPDTTRAALQRPGLQLHGRIEDLKPWMDRCLASLAPLRFGAGVKGKINMSMSYGLPVIGTGTAIEGMYLHHGDNVLQANQPEQFVQAVQQLMTDEALWMRLSDASLDNVQRHFSPSSARDTLRAVLD